MRPLIFWNISHLPIFYGIIFMGIFTIEPGLAIWTWVAFGILLFIMYKFVFPTLMQNIKEREKAISDAVDNADEIKQRLTNIESEHTEMISKAHKESDKILRKTRETASTLKKKLLLKAENEATAILEEAKSRIGEERKIAIESMKKDIAVMVSDSTEKVIDHSFLKDDDKKWVENLVDNIQ